MNFFHSADALPNTRPFDPLSVQIGSLDPDLLIFKKKSGKFVMRSVRLFSLKKSIKALKHDNNEIRGFQIPTVRGNG